MRTEREFILELYRERDGVAMKMGRERVPQWSIFPTKVLGSFELPRGS